ncbi:hypothetical protein ACFSTC_38600 [Nonomuraea ferruginea]
MRRRRRHILRRADRLGPPADPSQISGEITWWDTVRPDSEGPTFQKLIKEFEAKYPKNQDQVRQRPLRPGAEPVPDSGPGQHRRPPT